VEQADPTTAPKHAVIGGEMIPAVPPVVVTPPALVIPPVAFVPPMPEPPVVDPPVAPVADDVPSFESLPHPRRIAAAKMDALTRDRVD